MARERTLLLTGFDSEIASDIVEAFAFDEAYDIALTFSEQTEFAVEESDRLKEITEGRVRVIKQVNSARSILLSQQVLVCTLMSCTPWQI
jgi:hypothetical protein